MAGTTPNFSWPYPESSDFVADGATAIENLADAIDTTANGWGTWTTYTPTVTSGTGTITSYTAAGDYCRINDLVVVQFRVTITVNGTAGANIQLTLPLTPTTSVGANPNIGGAIENAIGGAFIQVELQSGLAVCRTYSYGYPGGTGRRIVGTLTYKAA